MKTTLKTTLIVASLVGFLIPASGANAATFKNCTALRAKYPNGVAKSASAAKKQKAKPKVSASVYKSVAKMDRDKDGVACEK